MNRIRKALTDLKTLIFLGLLVALGIALSPSLVRANTVTVPLSSSDNKQATTVTVPLDSKKPLDNKHDTTVTVTVTVPSDSKKSSDDKRAATVTVHLNSKKPPDNKSAATVTSPLSSNKPPDNKSAATVTSPLSANKPPDNKSVATATSPLRSQMPLDINRILQRGKLVVAILNNDEPPFFMSKEGGQLDGLDVKLAQEIASQLGVSLEFDRSAKKFDEVVDRVYELDADIGISKLSRTLNRAKKIRYSLPYLTMKEGLLVNRRLLAQQTGNTKSPTLVIRNLSDQIGVIQGSSYATLVKKRFPQGKIVEFSTWSKAVEAVGKGEIFAAYRDELEAKKVVVSQPDIALELQPVTLTDTQDSIAIVLPWDSVQLLAFVNQLLETTEIKYTVDGLLKEYLQK